MKGLLRNRLLLWMVLWLMPLSASARWYDAGSGRFLSEDPLLKDRDTTRQRLPVPTSLSAWLYANGNPVRYTDPDGRQSIEPQASGNGLLLMCGFAELTGMSVDFCKNPNQVADTAIAMNKGEARGQVTGGAAAVGLYFGGPKGFALGLSLGYTLDVAQQSYEDPHHFKTLDEIDHLGALERGTLMSAVPPGLGLLSKTGRLGQVAVAGTTLYFAGQGMGEGAGQLVAASENKGDYGRYVYGTSLMLFGATGAGFAHQQVTQSLPFGRLPTWLFADLEPVGQASVLPGGSLPVRLNFRVAEYRQAMLVLSQERARANLPPAGHKDDVYTMAMLEIDGKPYVGREAGIPMQDRGAFLDLMKEAAAGKGANGAAGAFVDHAEGTAFYNAFMKGAQGRTAKLFVDRELCPYCLRSVSNARHILGLEELVVYDPKYPHGRIFPLR
jgi:RHS repeat-associated protein